MKIAIITHNIVKGDGQGRVTYELAHYLAGRGHQVHLFAHHLDPVLARMPGIKAHHVPVVDASNLVKGISFALAVGLRVGWGRYDIIHNNGDAAFFSTHVNTCHFCHSAVPPRLGRPGTGGQAMRLYHRLYRALHATVERYVYRGSAAVVAVSHKVAGELTEHAGVPASRVRVVHSGVDSQEFMSNGTRGQEGGLRVLFVGDLSTPLKGLDTALEALPLLPEQVTLSVVGRVENSAYPRQVAASAMAHRVRFLGFRADMAAVYAQHDAFVLPTHYDTFGLVVLEAMAAGLPVVVSAQAGVREVVEQGKNGFVLTDPADAQGLAAYLRLLLDDGDLRAELGRQARATALTYSWERMAQQVEAIYHEVDGAALPTPRRQRRR